MVEIEERVRADGTVEHAARPAGRAPTSRRAFADGFRAVAIVLMHGYRHPQHEPAVAALARDIGFTPGLGRATRSAR